MRDFLKLFLVLGFLSWISFTLNLIEKKNEIVYATNEVTLTNTSIVEKIVPYIITEKLPTDFNKKKEMIQMYLRSLGETEEDITTWDRIINTESRYDVDSKAPTFWSQCSDGRFIELKKYESGGYWQAVCSDYGLETVESGHSAGLLHIIAPTARGNGCNNINWIHEIECGVKIKNTSGFSQWASY